MANTENICGECRYNSYNQDIGDYVCDNTYSENYGMDTLYDDSCEDFEEKES